MTVYDSVRTAIGYIEANLHRDIGVLDVANAVSYSQFYFSREFSRHTHISVYDYILRRKLTESYRQLFQSEDKIVDLAFRFGFQSHEVFTRAFRKMFGESPSEAAVYRPLALYETIDEDYLAFLKDLRVEKTGHDVAGRYFEPEAAGEPADGCCSLVLLSDEGLRERRCTLTGRLADEAGCRLAFPLRQLHHKIRVCRNDARHALRYFIDNHYNADEIGGNYILLLGEDTHVDVLIPKT